MGSHLLTLTDEIARRISALLASGVPIKDACADCQIQVRSFYHWRKLGRDLLAAVAADPDLPLTDDAQRLISFYHSVTRASSQAQIVAVSVIRSAMVVRSETTTTTKTRKRTKVATTRRTYWMTLPNGEREQVSETVETPYTDEDTVVVQTVREILPDAHIALEFLARRNPDVWAKRLRLEVEWREKAISQIQSGELTWEILSEMFDAEYATEMYFDAGVEPPPQALEAGVIQGVGRPHDHSSP